MAFPLGKAGGMGLGLGEREREGAIMLQSSIRSPVNST